jgi:hypothetical protein
MTKFRSFVVSWAQWPANESFSSIIRPMTGREKEIEVVFLYDYFELACNVGNWGIQKK